MLSDTPYQSEKRALSMSKKGPGALLPDHCSGLKTPEKKQLTLGSAVDSL